MQRFKLLFDAYCCIVVALPMAIENIADLRSTHKPPVADSQKPNWFLRRFGRIREDVYVDMPTTATFLPSGRAVMEAQKNLIIHAEDHSYHQTYSFDMDRVGQEFMDAWRDKHEKDPQVKQHILVDNSIAWWNANGTVSRVKDARQLHDETFVQLNHLEEEGIATVRITNWFHLQNILHSNPFHRDHKKITSADGKKAIVGSVNTGAHHDMWLDGGVLLEGPAAKVVEEDVENTLAETSRWTHVFKASDVWDYFKRGYWKDAISQPDKFKDDLLGSIVRNPQRRGSRVIIHGPDNDQIVVATDSYFRPYREATRLAQELHQQATTGDVLDVTSPYPGMMIETGELMRAAKRGAEVNLHMPAKNNYSLYNPRRMANPFVRKILEANLALWKLRLKVAGVHVYEYEGDAITRGMIHFKSVSLRKKDGMQKVLIGSMNLSMGLGSGSNREIGVLLTNHHKEFSQEYNAFMDMVKKQSQKIF